MTIKWGKIHKYAGMTIYYSSPGKVKFSTVNYIANMLGDITEDMKEELAIPDAHHLFDAAEDATKLYQTDA